MVKILSGALILVAGLFMLSASTVLAQGGPCEADFECDGDVDADDVDKFLEDFGRFEFNNPCPDCYDSPCPCTAPGCDPPAQVAKTGQTTSYATGDDGDLNKGVAWPNPRFTDNADGTVTDTLTGLIWLKDANCFGERTWIQALSDCSGLAAGSCGLTDGSNAGDWRLPNVREFQTLISIEVYAPAIQDLHPFESVSSEVYWTSSTLSFSPTNAWIIGMFMGSTDYDEKTWTYFVWPVRGPE